MQESEIYLKDVGEGYVTIVMEPGQAFCIKTPAGLLRVEVTQDTADVTTEDDYICFNSEKEYLKPAGEKDDGEWVRRTPMSDRYRELLNEEAAQELEAQSSGC